ncbi:MAG: hypothetical protein E2O40_07210 [Planctomycetota bacterium]|nr:MAG: hypothetical protein E2O40_07210 [Planctomycetota bacterium]
MTKAATPPTEPPGQRTASPALQRSRDEQHLTSLVVAYYVMAGLTLMFGCAGVLYLVFGVGIVFLSDDLVAADPNAPPQGVIQLIGGVLAGVGVLIALLQFVSTVLLVMTARFLATRRYRTFCLVVAGLTCLSVPLGTALGVFTFVVLARPGVIERFGGRRDKSIGR